MGTADTSRDRKGISPSMLKAFGYRGHGCPLRGYFRYALGRRDPSGPGALHGSEMHDQAEQWLLRGKPPAHRHALAAIREAPRPLTCLPESKIRWTLDGLNFMGIMDFMGGIVSLAETRTTPHFAPGDALLIGDFKFVSSFDHALVPYEGLLVDRDTLEPDVQSTMYASKFFLAEGYDEVHGKWIYVPTKTKGCKPYIAAVKFSKGRVAEEMVSVVDYAASVKGLVQIRPKLSDIPRNEGWCRAYNQPCPYETDCPKKATLFNADTAVYDDSPDEDNEPIPEEDMGKKYQEEINRLLAAQGVADDDEPPPPLDEDDDVPPPLDEEDAPEEEETRALVEAELAARRAAEGKVGARGIVNPPEADETAPATPEEAYERYGDKPKATFVFTKEHRPALLAKAVEMGLVDVKSRVTAPGLAKMLRQKKVDPEAIVADLDPDGLPKGSLASQANAEQAAHAADRGLVVEVDTEAIVAAVADVAKLSDEELTKAHEESVMADAADAPGAAEYVEACEKEMAARQIDGKPGPVQRAVEAAKSDMSSALDGCRWLANTLKVKVTIEFSPEV